MRVGGGSGGVVVGGLFKPRKSVGSVLPHVVRSFPLTSNNQLPSVYHGSRTSFDSRLD